MIRPRDLAAPLLLAGCVACSPKFVPSKRVTVHEQGVAARVAHVVAFPGYGPLRIHITLESQTPVAVSHFGFGSAATACGEGHRARQVTFDGIDIDATLPVQASGRHEVELESELLDGRTALDVAFVDLAVADESGWKCLRVPVTTATTPLRMAKRALVYLRIEGSAALADAAGVGGGAGAELGMGTWLSPFRLTAGGAARSVSCSPSRCPPVQGDSGQRDRRAFAAVASIAATAFPLIYDRDAFGFGLEYQLTSAFLPAYEGRATQLVHTPRFVLSWTQGYRNVGGFEDGNHPGAFELSLPIGLQIAEHDGNWSSGVTLGFAFGAHGML